MRRQSGLVIGPDKRYLMEARLAPLMAREGLAGLDALASHLAAGGCSALERAVAEAMATHETMFFRDVRPFEHLRTIGLPRLLRDRPAGARLRMWSAAAATGQEAYSMAITAAEAGALGRQPIEILGTDFAREPLRRARAGRYDANEMHRGLSASRRLRHFTPVPGGWRINPAVRAPCSFREWNLLDDPAPLGRFDVVFCRNVLFYFDATTRMRVLTSLVRQMAPDGLLYLGSSESAVALTDQLRRDGPCHVIACRQHAAA